MDAIQISNVTKRYRDTLALEGISFRFEAGRIYGLLGRNGAGKSTLIILLPTGYLPRTAVSPSMANRCVKTIGYRKSSTA